MTFPGLCLYCGDDTVWPEILSFGEFTLAVEPVRHSDIHNKMANRMPWELIEL